MSVRTCVCSSKISVTFYGSSYLYDKSIFFEIIKYYKRDIKISLLSQYQFWTKRNGRVRMKKVKKGNVFYSKMTCNL